MIMLNNRAEFVEYVLAFYGAGGIYDFGAEAADVERALDIRLERRADLPFDGDSLDREIVRDIMLEELGLDDLDLAPVSFAPCGEGALIV
jgi:hypothetical protein